MKTRLLLVFANTTATRGRQQTRVIGDPNPFPRLRLFRWLP